MLHHCVMLLHRKCKLTESQNPIVATSTTRLHNVGMQMISVGIGIEFFLLGACLILWGLRRNRQQVTLCTQCKGRLDDQHDVTTTCPHCQQDLRQPDARLTQQANVLSVQMIAGVLCLAVCLIWFLVQPVIRLELSKIIGLELAAFGVLGVLWALWGKHARQHYFCSRCEYDLTGVAYKISACPECGCNLSNEKAVCHTSKKIRFRDMFIAFAMLGLGIVFLRVDLVNKFNELEWIEYKFDAWVVADAIKEMDADSDLDERDNFDELVRRINGDKLSDVQKQRIAQRLIDQHHDLVDYYLYGLLQCLYDQECLTVEQGHQVIKIFDQGASSVFVRSNWSIGRRLPLCFGSHNPVFIHGWMTVKDIRIELFLDGQRIDVFETKHASQGMPNVYSSVHLDQKKWADRIGKEVKLSIVYSGLVTRSKIAGMVNQRITSKQEQLISLVSRDQALDLFLPEPQLDQAMDQGWVKSLIRSDGQSTDVWLKLVDMPRPMSMSLWACYDQREVRLGSVCGHLRHDKENDNDWFYVSGPALEGQPSHVRLELRADPFAALRQWRTRTYWQGDLQRLNVPVNPKLGKSFTLDEQNMAYHQEQVITQIYRDLDGDLCMTFDGGAHGFLMRDQLQLWFEGKWVVLTEQPDWQITMMMLWDGYDATEHVICKGLPREIDQLKFRVNANHHSYRTAPWGYMLLFDQIPIGTPDKPNTQEYSGHVKYLDVGY
ncbi:MAG: hypothetical protein CMJ19_21505 [Phycisphaeraceae bacterium]|nr:hypothetical protein [Phycisphaeraceae bacterium]